MLTYAKLKRNRRKCVALTGLTPKEFAVLLPAFARAYAEHYPAEKTVTGKPRQRQVGGGRKSGLHEPEQKLLFILVHQKAYPLQTLLGEVFEVSQPRVNEWIHRLLPILKAALDNLEAVEKLPYPSVLSIRNGVFRLKTLGNL
jgi:Helix-turn-helix of DDE superfamily endonuclease